MNRSEILCFLEELLEDSAEMRPITGKSFLEEGIDELQDRLVAEGYRKEQKGKLDISVYLDFSDAIHGSSDVHNAIREVKNLDAGLRRIFFEENKINLGVEINE